MRAGDDVKICKWHWKVQICLQLEGSIFDDLIWSDVSGQRPLQSFYSPISIVSIEWKDLGDECRQQRCEPVPMVGDWVALGRPQVTLLKYKMRMTTSALHLATGMEQLTHMKLFMWGLALCKHVLCLPWGFNDILCFLLLMLGSKPRAFPMAGFIPTAHPWLCFSFWISQKEVCNLGGGGTFL